MNKIKGLYNLYTEVDSSNIDPFNFITPNGPWIGGSFALWHYIDNPTWQYNDIDYFVRTDDQAKELLKYFTSISKDKNEIYKNIFKFTCDDKIVQVNANPYADVRLRLQHADLSNTKIAHNGKQFIVDRMFLDSINKNQFMFTGNTFNIDRTNKRIDLYKDRGFSFNDKYLH